MNFKIILVLTRYLQNIFRAHLCCIFSSLQVSVYALFVLYFPAPKKKSNSHKNSQGTIIHELHTLVYPPPLTMQKSHSDSVHIALSAAGIPVPDAVPAALWTPQCHTQGRAEVCEDRSSHAVSVMIEMSC